MNNKVRKFVKKFLKRIIEVIVAKDTSRIYSLIDSYDYVTFDVFDTLINRDVKEPNDVFWVIEQILKANDNENLSHYAFYTERIQAEKKARANSIYGEVNLNDIYHYMNHLQECDAEKLMNLEIQIEHKLCCQNREMAKVFEYCKQKGKLLAIVSDMYLSSETINSILSKCGYSHDAKIYISNEHNANKAKGKLFQTIIVNEEIADKKVLHIGDSLMGDFVSAKKYGFGACLFKRKKQNLSYYSNSIYRKLNSIEQKQYGALTSFINNHKDDSDNPYETIGYEVLGPLIWGFAEWLHTQIKQDNIEKVLFLARDGMILQQAYEYLYTEKNNSYFHISRKAAINLVTDMIEDYTEFIELLGIGRYITIKEIGDMCDMHSIQIRQLCEKMEKDYCTPISKFLSTDEFLCAFTEAVADAPRTNRDLFYNYVDKFNLSGQVALVDIGWAGRIQYCLQKLYAQEQITFKGFYFGTIQKKGSMYCQLNQNSFLGNMTDTSPLAREILETRACFEWMFLNPEGTTVSYIRKENGEVYPKKMDKEYSDEELEKVKIVHAHAMKFVRDMKCNSCFRGQYFMPDILFKGYEQFAVYPNMTTVNMFKNVNFLAEHVQKMGAMHSLGYYIFNPSKFIRELQRSSNRIFFLKSIFKIPLPYFKLLFFAYRKD